MKVHEFQGKEILRRYGVPLPIGKAAKTVQEAVDAANELGGSLWVVKSQIHAGGRGKGRFIEHSTDEQITAAADGHPLDGLGGVQLTRSIDEVRAAAESIAPP